MSIQNKEFKYSLKIEKIIKHLREELRIKGNYENFGQKELRRFKEKVNSDYGMTYEEKRNVITLLDERIQEIQ